MLKIKVGVYRYEDFVLSTACFQFQAWKRASLDYWKPFKILIERIVSKYIERCLFLFFFENLLNCALDAVRSLIIQLHPQSNFKK